MLLFVNGLPTKRSAEFFFWHWGEELKELVRDGGYSLRPERKAESCV